MTIIYSITSDKGDKVYIGRTTDTLAGRKRQHKSQTNHCRSTLLFDEYGFENCIFTVLEECEEEQQVERERFYVENTPNTVNRQIPGRTYAEYRETNRDRRNSQNRELYHNTIEHQKARAKAYYEANKEKILQRQLALRLKKKSIE